jgi:nucleoid-associated protein YgaU
MALAKLTIIVENGRPIVTLFNPSQITINKTVNWREVPKAERDLSTIQFTNGNPSVLTMDLFFDTYEQGLDVRPLTKQIAALTTIEQHGELHRPPICHLVWGLAGVFFQGVLESLTQRFTLFHANGLPARATLSCTFKEWRSEDEMIRLLNLQSADVAKTRTVRRGDTLSSIAAEEYNDAMLWRPLAEANRINNPRVLTPGQVLVVPVLRPDSGGRR